jgi:hypothetical protein
MGYFPDIISFPLCGRYRLSAHGVKSFRHMRFISFFLSPFLRCLGRGSGLLSYLGVEIFCCYAFYYIFFFFPLLFSFSDSARLLALLAVVLFSFYSPERRRSGIAMKFLMRFFWFSVFTVCLVGTYVVSTLFFSYLLRVDLLFCVGMKVDDDDAFGLFGISVYIQCYNWQRSSEATQLVLVGRMMIHLSIDD